MLRKLTVAALLLASTAASAQNVQQPTKYVPAPLPPVEYERAFEGELTILAVNDLSVVRLMCQNDKSVACAFHDAPPAKVCIIVLGPGYQKDIRALRHELGHCNGWPKDHPGGRPWPAGKDPDPKINAMLFETLFRATMTKGKPAGAEALIGIVKPK